ncbi:MAG: proteasome endopeptidase complex, archaeal, alpha subunit [Thermoprotei archaeon]|mgnify:CR=1 FL=1|nr:MAG: proteasome endopeptidase complex, archaeal, alpha subunit [Thermoprotei archaeon]
MGLGLPATAAYDRAITIFAPDGRIYQVEYAFESVRRGWTTLGIKSKEGAVVVVHKKKTSPLIDDTVIQKIFIVDDHIGATFAGIASDGRVLVDYARHLALVHRFYYDEPITVEYLARQICDVKQAYTQHAGVRPFGVAIILVGVDDQPKLYMTEPSGRYLSYYAVVIGEKSSEANSIIEKKYRYDYSLKDIIKLGIETIASVSEEKIGPENIEAGYISVEEKRFKIMKYDEIKKYIDELIEEGKIK